MRGFSQWGKSFSEIESSIIYFYEIFVKHSIRLVQKFKKLIVKTQGQENIYDVCHVQGFRRKTRPVNFGS